ncbi:hypothetical protein LCGC14_0045400 [marine sediment metagenome]|uniref:Uncharacterized protein n=2 Tax=root TaxID=1 RepID=A0A7V1BIR4_9RHOB|nr:hypothetical protein [Sulfitobacter litoralis]HDZ53585.1 hypothetical protein [Sulfitobacter litoralis]
MTIELGFDHKSATPYWQKVQGIRQSVQSVDTIPHFSNVVDEAVLSWIDAQVEDLSVYAKPIRKIQEDFANCDIGHLQTRISKSDALIKNLTHRTERLVDLKRDAVDVRALAERLNGQLRDHQADFEKLDADPTGSQSLAEFEGLMSSLEAKAQDLEQKVEVLSAKLQSETTARMLQAAQEGRRPIRDALAKECEKLREYVSSQNLVTAAPAGATAPEPIASKPAASKQQSGPPIKGQSNSDPNPQIQLRRKELGGALSAGEVYRRTEVYFKALWEAEIEQKHCGAILFFEPTASRGISIHDLLGLSNTDVILEQAKTQILARFGRRD